MSEVKVNKISPRANCGTVTLGDSGDSFVIPSGATITNNGTQTGFGREGSVDWVTDSIKTATFTAVSGKGYFCNTAGGSFEVDLPAGSAGAIVSIQDYNNTFDSNSLEVDPNGSEKINGGTAGSTVTLSTEGQGVTFVYIDSTVGWRTVAGSDDPFAQAGETPTFITATGGTITTSGDYKIHTFTSPGTFCISAGAGSLSRLDYVVVAGGGGGGKQIGGGGGAGGYRESHSSPVSGPYTASPLASTTPLGPFTAQAIPVTIGAGGAGGTTTCCTASSGSSSIFSTITSAGGGGAANNGVGVNGGSGGGNGVRTESPVGQGNTPPVSPPQGNNGGAAKNSPGGAGGGGGGAGAVGGDAVSPPGGPGCNAGNGGAGVTSSITASPVARAGGGGAGGRATPGVDQTPGGSGGTGGGGAGTANPSGATAGTANTGGGGGGTGYHPSPGADGAAGGSGIVIIRYKFQ